MFKYLNNSFKIILFLVLSVVSFVQFAVAQSSETANTNAVQTSQSTFFSKENWGASYFNYMNAPTFAEPQGGSINHYLALKRKLGKQWAVSGVFRPDSNFGNDKTSVTMGDPYLKIDYPLIYDGGENFKIKGDVRYYAPVSEASQKSEIAGSVAPFFNTTAKMGDLNLTYILIPKFFLNTSVKSGQKLYSHGHWMAAAYKLSSLINLDFGLYPTWTVTRNQPTAFNDLPAYPGFTLNFSDAFSVSPYVEIPLLKAAANTSSIGGTLSYTFL